MSRPFGPVLTWEQHHQRHEPHPLTGRRYYMLDEATGHPALRHCNYCGVYLQPRADADPLRECLHSQTRQPDAAERRAMSGVACPTCGHRPVESRGHSLQRRDLAVVWLYVDPRRPGEVIECRHCVECQPHNQFQSVVCPLCGDGPMIAGDLSEAMPDENTLPGPVRRWLAGRGWHDQTGVGLVCADHGGQS